ncbi:MAG TPA: aromatic aminobenezylarsenical efflux permease ArsG family transporter [Candidatus Omnitrophota bacterium]|nr:aromatic aminobenezylarsenical efflux permease ArsG family transporter [Candidatus Omnitrophota bacterium]
MNEVFIPIVSALWLGILTSISPCPLASNVAAISFLSKKIVHPFLVFISGFFYALGRVTAYVFLGWIIIHSFVNMPELARFLQSYMGKILGPVLIIIGVILLDLIKIRFPSVNLPVKFNKRLAEAGAPGAFLLGIIFALAFCPVSAALFFGSLIPLALNSKGGAILPFIYGIGTGFPVLLFAVAMALGVTSLSRWFNKITKIEYYSRKITGFVFVLVGIYYSMIYIFKI